MKISKNILFLILILAVGFGLRFYDFGNRISLDWEASRDYFVSLVAVRELQLPLTGPWASIAPLTTGPWYWYYLILSRVFLPSVYAPWLAIGLASTLGILMMYKIGTVIKDENLGLILAFLTAFSPNLIDSSLLLTNPSIVFFLTSLVLLIFLSIFRKPIWYLGILLGVFIGVTLLTHYQGAGLLILPLFLLLLKRERFKMFFNTLLGLFIASLPILFFELNNHWFDTRGIINFIFHTQYRLWTSMSWKILIFDFYPQVWGAFVGGSKLFGFILMVGSAAALAYRILRKNISRPLLLLFLHFSILLIIIRYWRGERYLGWLQFFGPYLLIFSGLLFYDLFFKHASKRFLTILFISGLLYLIAVKPSLERIYTDNIFKQRDRKIRNEINNLLKLNKNRKFSLYLCRAGGEYGKSYMVLLSLNKSLDKEGYKIAIDDTNCNIPLDKNGKTTRLLGSILDFHQVSESAILANDWQRETEESIYDSYVKWWYKEKP